MAQPQASIFHIECPRIGTVRVAVRNSAKSRNFRLWADSPNSAVLSKPYYASVNDALEFARANAEWLSKALEKFSPAIALCEYFEDNPRIFGEEGEIKVWLKPSSLNEFFVQAKGELAIVYKAGDKAGSVERVFKDFARGSWSGNAQESRRKRALGIQEFPSGTRTAAGARVRRRARCPLTGGLRCCHTI